MNFKRSDASDQSMFKYNHSDSNSLKDSDIRFSKFLPMRGSYEFNPKIVYSGSK